MTWIRNGSFPLLPSGLEITFTLQSNDGRHTWITIKGEDHQMAEHVAKAISGLNLASEPDVGGQTHSIDEVGPEVAEARPTDNS